MLTNVEAEGMLRRIKSTASGCDSIPAWLLRSCSYELADIVTYILNLSFSTGKVPTFWLNALVTPVPKVSKPTGFLIFVLYQLHLTSVDLLKRLLCAAGCDQQYHLNS